MTSLIVDFMAFRWSFVWGIMSQKGTTKCGAVAQFFNNDDPSNKAVSIVTKYFFI